jgi:hypothetical protein
MHAVPQSDEDWLYDLAGVTELARRRYCKIEVVSDFQLRVKRQKIVTLDAIAPGKWEPVAIIKACTLAAARVAYDVDAALATPIREELDEFKIARVAAAAGLKPYLTRKGRHHRDGFHITRALNGQGLRLVAQGYQVVEPGLPLAQPGQQSWNFMSLLTNYSDRDNNTVRAALQALLDVGLITQDPTWTGLCTKSVLWTERARKPRPAPRPMAFAADDDNALECIALGIA